MNKIHNAVTHYTSSIMIITVDAENVSHGFERPCYRLRDTTCSLSEAELTLVLFSSWNSNRQRERRSQYPR